MVVDHDNVEVSNLHRQVIHTEEGRLKSKARSAHDAMRDLNSTVLVTTLIKPLTWDNALELVRGNDCAVDAINNYRMRYLINNVYVLAGKETNTSEMMNCISSRRGSPILLVSGSAMGTEGRLRVNSYKGGGVTTNVYTLSSTLS